MSSPVYQPAAYQTPAFQNPAYQPTVLDALRSSPAGPFLDLPLPQLPQPSATGALPPMLPSPIAAAPALPPNPLDMLLQGDGIPALPGIDQLLKPLTDLASGFGSGVLGAFDPTQILSQVSSALDGALQLGQTGLKGLDQVWQSGAAQNAQAMGQSAQVSGDEVSKRGKDISAVTRDAAGSVERGNIKLAGIVQSFVATAVAAAPVIFTPPGQAMLMASAADHLGQALAVVAQTRGELTTHTAHMAALAGPLSVPAGPAPMGAPGQSPFAAASQAVDQGKPLIDSATKSVEGVVQGVSGNSAGSDPSSTYASGLGSGADGSGALLGPAATHAAGTSIGGGGVGGAGGLGSGALGLLGGGSAAGGRQALGSAAPGGLSGAPGAPTGGVAGVPTGTTASGMSGMGGMGGMMGAAGRGGGGDNEHNTPSYLNRPVNNSDVVGELPRVVSPVIGAPDPDEFDDVHDDYLD
ncbi:hypothetical protein [Antrihabitans cavernicola]|uniref:Uncharacterized protein n=1 Tax=Antrihabitans cavernicola TaxID=2495913 RepID=A0A5A7SFS4_9NOCA|nr:hypothetical protein [Spelaeibacter cavernicola]KAA0023483.1 hypothetical protein FOY51_08765 [Spelaeibacter cavernicola]